jgi:hypothetical protein
MSRRGAQAQQAFLERGRASLDKARETGELYPLNETLDRMKARLEKRMAEHRRASRRATDKP